MYRGRWWDECARKCSLMGGRTVGNHGLLTIEPRAVLLVELLYCASVAFMALPKFWARALARKGYWARPHQVWAQRDCPKSVESLEHQSMTEVANAAREVPMDCYFTSQMARNQEKSVRPTSHSVTCNAVVSKSACRIDNFPCIYAPEEHLLQSVWSARVSCLQIQFDV